MKPTTRLWLQFSCIAMALAISGCETSIPKEKSGGGASNKPQTSGKDSADSSASKGGGKKRIMILTNGDSPFWDACREGMKAANSELKLADSGLEATMDVNDNTPQGQLSKLQQYGAQGDIAAVGISAVGAKNDAIANELRNLQKKGIKVVTIDSDVDRSQFRDARFAFIGTDNLSGGKVLGKCAQILRPDGGEYVTFVGLTGAQNAIERIGGFGSGAGEKFTDKDKMGDGGDRTIARENVRNAIRNHAGLNVLVGIWSYNAPAIVDVVRELNRRKDFTVVVFDAEPDAITAMGEGQIDAMVVQNPFEMGYQGVRLMKALHEDDKKTISEMLPNHGQPEGDIFETGLKVVVPDGSSPIKADAFSKGVQFLELPAFREWLTKYGLTGS